MDGANCVVIRSGVIGVLRIARGFIPWTVMSTVIGVRKFLLAIRARLAFLVALLPH